MTPVVITGEAEADLENIADYIASDNPARAATFVAELREKAEAIGHMPHAYPPRPDLGPDFRTAIYGRYLIVFRDLPEAVYVLRVVHGARDLLRLFNR